MNWENIQGKWKRVSGEAKKQWGKLTDDELMEIDGSREAMVGKLQERYGIEKEEAEKQIEQFGNKLDDLLSS